MNSSPLATIPLFAAIPSPGSALSASLFVQPISLKDPFPLDRIAVPPSRFSTSSLFATISTRLDLTPSRDMYTVEDADPETEFPYPYYMDEDAIRYGITIVEVADKAEAEEANHSRAARQTVRFPQPGSFVTEPRSVARKARVRKKPEQRFLRGAEIFLRKR